MKRSRRSRLNGGISVFYSHKIGDFTLCLVKNNVVALQGPYDRSIDSESTHVLVKEIVCELETLPSYSASFLIIAGGLSACLGQSISNRTTALRGTLGDFRCCEANLISTSTFLRHARELMAMDLTIRIALPRTVKRQALS